MKRLTLIPFALVACGMLFLASSCEAALTYTVRFEQPEFTLDYGQQVRLGILLEESSDAPGSDTFQLMTTGMAGAELRVTRSGAGDSIITNARWGNGFLSSGFITSDAGHTPDSAFVRNVGVSVLGTMATANTAILDIGYIDVTAGAQGGINDFQLSFFDGTNNFVLQNSTVLDTSINDGGGLGSARITAVPEPTSLGVFALLGAGLIMRRRRE